MDTIQQHRTKGTMGLYDGMDRQQGIGVKHGLHWTHDSAICQLYNPGEIT